LIRTYCCKVFHLEDFAVLRLLDSGVAPSFNYTSGVKWKRVSGLASVGELVQDLSEQIRLCRVSEWDLVRGLGQEGYVDDDELGGRGGGESNNNVDAAEVDVLLGHGSGVAADEVGVGRASADEGALEEEGLEEVFDSQAELGS
jgi:hypothetical protein